MSEDERLALSYACPYCAAQPGAWCVTRPMASRGMSQRLRLEQTPTRRSPWLHADRTRPIMAAWRNGYVAGRGDGHDTALDQAARRAESWSGAYGGAGVASWLRNRKLSR